jgi:hypothetical protein
MTRLMEAIAAHDYFEARDAANDLRGWLRKGGAMPTLSTDQLRTLLTATAERCGDIAAAMEE